MLDKCPHSQGLCPLPDDAFLYSNTHSPLYRDTDMQCQQSHWGQHLFGDKVTLLPRGLWTGTMKASHPAHTQPAVLGWWRVEGGWGWGWGVRGITTPCYRSFKTLFRKPPEIAPFTPRTDGAKSLLVTQSHAVNRWSSYWVKDRAGRGGSSSIPAGNNGAAGQECRLQEEGSGRRSMLQHSRAMQALWNWRNWENLFFRMKGGGEEARGCVWGWLSGIKLRLRVLVCESGTAVFVFNLQTRTKRHLPVCTLFAGSEETQPRGLTRIQGPTVTDTRSSSCTKSCTSGTDNFIVDKKKKALQWGFTHREERKPLPLQTAAAPWGHFFIKHFSGYT